MVKTKFPIPVAVVVLLLTGCSSNKSSPNSTLDGSKNPDSSKTEISTYAGFDDCAAVLDWTKAEMLKRVGPYGLETYPYMYENWRSNGFEGDMAAPTEAPATDSSSGADSLTVSVTVTCHTVTVTYRY